MRDKRVIRRAPARPELDALLAAEKEQHERSMIDTIAEALCEDELPGVWKHSSEASRQLWRRRATIAALTIAKIRYVGAVGGSSMTGHHPSGQRDEGHSAASCGQKTGHPE